MLMPGTCHWLPLPFCVSTLCPVALLSQNFVLLGPCVAAVLTIASLSFKFYPKSPVNGLLPEKRILLFELSFLLSHVTGWWPICGPVVLRQESWHFSGLMRPGLLNWSVVSEVVQRLRKITYYLIAVIWLWIFPSSSVLEVLLTLQE